MLERYDLAAVRAAVLAAIQTAGTESARGKSTSR
jgi:hypothetical protein